MKLTPTMRRTLQFIADGRERGRMILQITASGGRAGSQLQALRNAGYLEYCGEPSEPDRIRITAAGLAALSSGGSR